MIKYLKQNFRQIYKFSTNFDEKIKQKDRLKYSKQKAINEIVSDYFFTQDEKIMIQDFQKKEQTDTFTYEQANQILNEDEQLDLEEFLQTEYFNKKILENYRKEDYNLIHSNLQNQKYIQRQQEYKFMKLKQKLQTIDKGLELQNSMEFLTLKQIMRNQSFINAQEQALELVNENNIEDSIKLILSLQQITIPNLQFQQKINQIYESKKNDMNLQELLLAIDYFKNNNQEKLDLLLISDFQQIKKQQILKVLAFIVQKSNDDNLKQMMELFCKLEPYIIKYLNQYDTKQLYDVYIKISLSQLSSEELVQIIQFKIIQKINYFSIGQILQMINKSSRLYYRRDVFDQSQFDNFTDILHQKIIALLPNNQIDMKQIRIFLQFLTQKNEDKISHYEFISIQFIRILNNQEVLQKREDIMIIYYQLTYAGIISQPITEIIQNFNAIKQQEIKGYIEDKQTQNTKELEKDQYQSLKFNIQFLWALVVNLQELNMMEKANFDLINKQIKDINNQIQINQKNSQIVQCQQNLIEMMYQINLILKTFGFNMFPRYIQVDQFLMINLKIHSIMYQRPLSDESQFLILERKIFYKYMEIRYPQKFNRGVHFLNYYFHFQFKDEQIIFIFINDKTENLKERQSQFLKTRKLCLNIIDIPYIEIEAKDLLKFAEINPEKQSIIIHKYFQNLDQNEQIDLRLLTKQKQDLLQIKPQIEKQDQIEQQDLEEIKKDYEYSDDDEYNEEQLNKIKKFTKK